MIFPRTIFWDFDGVIKDSVEIKTLAFVKLFEPFGPAIAERVRKHHEANGGLSRFDKIPIYLRWVGEEPSVSRVNRYCDQFSQLVVQSVIEASWVPGVEGYLRFNPHQQLFVLVSATPQNELEKILYALNLKACFAEVFGAPTRKKDAIHMTLISRGLNSQECLMIGDAQADLKAAQDNQVPFLLRRHETNAEVFLDYSGASINDFVAF